MNKYLVFDSTDENKELLEKYSDVFNGMRDKIKEINSNECDYEKDYMKIKFNSDDDQKNKDVVLSKAKHYYKNNKDRLGEQARDKYKNLSEEEKNKKREHGKNRYHKMPEEKKTRPKEYQKKYYEAKKVSIYNNKIVC